MKLRPKFDYIVNSKVDTSLYPGTVEEPEDDIQSSGPLQLPPWAESYEISSTEIDGVSQWSFTMFGTEFCPDPHLHEDIQEDKLRRIRPGLEPGDVIDAVYTIARISGIDSLREYSRPLRSDPHAKHLYSWTAGVRP